MPRTTNSIFLQFFCAYFLLLLPLVGNAQTPPVDDVLSVNGASYSEFYQGPNVVWLEINHSGGPVAFDTFGSEFDTELGLYDANGNLIDENDDAGGLISELVFADLAAGNYFLASAGFNSSFSSTEFGASSTSSEMGQLVVRANTASQKLNLSGTITLPEGVAAQDIDLSVFLNGSSANFNVSVFQGANPTIAAGGDSIDYSIDFFPLDSGNYALEVLCDNNCGTIVTAFYTSSGPQFNFSNAQIAANSLPAVIDVELVFGQNLSGTLQLPPEQIADPSGVSNFITLSVFDSNQDLIGDFNTDVFIAAGESEATFNFNFPTAGDNGEYVLQYGCSFDCGSLRPEHYFTPTGTVFDFDSGRIDEASLPAVVDLQLEEQNVINLSGTINLPIGTADGDIEVFVSAFAFPNDGLGGQGAAAFVTILDGDSSVAYNFDVVDLTDGTYEVQFGCNSNCGNLIQNQFYTPDGVTFNFDEALFPRSELMTNIDFTLIEGLTLSGNIGLSEMELAGIDGLNTNVSVAVMDENQNLIGDFQNFQFISDGENSAPYSITFPSAGVNGRYVIGFSCSTCGTLEIQNFYTPSGTIYDYDLAQLTEAQLPAMANLILTEPPERTLSGSISLPSGVANGDVQAFIDVSVIDENFNFVDSRFESVTILDGESFSNYSFSLPTIPNTRYSIRFGCNVNCGEFLNNAYFTPNGIQYFFTQVDLVEVPDIIDFTFEEGVVFSGIVELPDGVANGAIPAAVSVGTFDAQGNQNGFFDATSRLRAIIPDGQSTGPFEMVVPIISEGHYQILYQCDDFNEDANCGDLFTGTTYFSTSGPTTNRSDAATQFQTLPINVVLPLITVQQISGNILFPDGQLSTRGTDVFATVFRYSDGILVEEISDFLFIGIGASSTPYTINFQTNPSDTFELELRCSSNCAGLLSPVYFTPQGMTDDRASAMLTLDDLPEVANLQFIELPVTTITGEVTLPSGVAEFNLDVNISLDTLDENGDFVDSSSATVTILAGESSAAYSLIAPDLAEGSYNLRYGCDQFISPCRLLLSETYFTPTGTAFTFNSGTFPIADLPDGQINLPLFLGESFSGNLVLPNGTAMNGGIENFISVQFIDIDGNFLGSTFAQPVIPNGESSTEFLIGLPPIADIASYRVNYGCQINCENLLSNIFFTPDGPKFTLSPEVQILRDDLPASGNILQLVEGSLLTGTLSLKDNELVTGQSLPGTINLFATENGEDLSFASFVFAFIPVGESSVPFSILVPPLDTEELVISFGCDEFIDGEEACGGFLTATFFQPTGTIFNVADAPFDPATLPASINLVLERAVSVNFDGRTPAEPIRTESARIDALVSIINSSNELLGTQSVTVFVSPDDPFLTPRSLLDAGEGGRYEITFECNGESSFNYDCSGYQITDQSYSLQFDINAIPDPIVLELIPEAAAPAVADSFEVDNLPDQASTLLNRTNQSHSIHEAGDVDWATFVIDEALPTIKITAIQDGTSDALELVLFDENLQQLATAAYPLGNNLTPPRQFAELIHGPIEAGTYFVEVRSIFPSGTVSNYQLRLDDLSPEEEEEICIPVVAKNGAIALICL